MTTMTEPTRQPRTDVHAPSTITPEDYQYVAQEYMKIESFGDCEIVQANRKLIREHMARTGGKYSGHEHGGVCMVCGSVNAIYTVLFYHAKTNSYVRMGQDCAEKCEMGDSEAFNAFRAGVKNALEARAGKAKAKAILEQNGCVMAWDVYETAMKVGPDTMQYEEKTIWDMVSKLIKYGSLSDAQLGFLKKLLERMSTRAERQAQREEERRNAKPCPTGRVIVDGVILSTKWQESQFGNTLKMLVKTEDGWCVWGTMPNSIALMPSCDGKDLTRGADKGDRVRFMAQVSPSNDDPKFGFFKRPTQAEMLAMVIKRPTPAPQPRSPWRD